MNEPLEDLITKLRKLEDEVLLITVDDRLKTNLLE